MNMENFLVGKTIVKVETDIWEIRLTFCDNSTVSFKADGYEGTKLLVKAKYMQEFEKQL